ncbi:MAG: GNAT family N-acetyltransferase [Deltaproteobacteria bacterium]|nr:GNAT family N-acetyltransferase [Deltaproteobacteria bacterium]
MATLRCIHETDELLRLAPAWEALLAQTKAPSFFLSWEWISAWQQVYRQKHRLCVIVAEEGGAPVGIAPFMIGGGLDSLAPRGQQLTRPIRFLKFLGQGECYPEQLDFLLPPGRAEELAPAFAKYALTTLSRQWDVLFLQNVQPEAAVAQAMEAWLLQVGLKAEHAETLSGPFAALPASKEEYWKGRSANFRSQYKNSANRLAKRGEVRLEIVTEESELEPAFAELVRLNSLRWGEENQSFHSEPYLQFHRQLMKRLLPRGELLLALLRVDGRVAAAKYDFVYGGKAWNYQGGWDPEFARERVGLVLLGRIVEHCIERGLAEYDFLGGTDAGYKDRFATGSRTTVDLLAPTRSLRGHAFRLARESSHLIQEQGLPEKARAIGARMRRITERLTGRAEPAPSDDSSSTDRRDDREP